VLTHGGRDLLGTGRDSERYAHLFETCFRRFNLGYGSPFEWPEGQHQAAFSLYRFGGVARDWSTARDLLDRRTVLPFALERLPQGPYDREAWVFETHILWHLERFGLMERRWDKNAPAYAYRLTSRWARFLEFSV
jgi:hypothetical protein